MNKFQIIKQLRNNGDSIITKVNGESIGVTIEFSERYIKRKRAQRFKIQKDCILLFSWTEDAFKSVRIGDIKSIMPLASILKNPTPEISVYAKT